MEYEIVIFGKTEMPVFFGFNALRKYCRNTGTTLQQLTSMGENLTLDDAVQLCLVGLEEGARKAKKDFSLNADDVADLLDESATALGDVMNVFSEQMGKQWADTDKKKTKKKAKPVNRK